MDLVVSENNNLKGLKELWLNIKKGCFQVVWKQPFKLINTLFKRQIALNDDLGAYKTYCSIEWHLKRQKNETLFLQNC